ncbi:MAG: DEAD/DEAH box helicase [Deltaproteobacteria bacterium]|nr:DEAD/DEAH box helicase [Deltaproteobacteria bacterium]
MLQPPPPPSPGAVVRARQRSWLVTGVVPGSRHLESALVHLACLDDDAAGEALSVLWSHELDAELVPDSPELLRPGAPLDPPARFGAYLHAMRWNTVTSTDPGLLQAPFRAGIDLKPYQLEPLRKALALPRVNLFIADDVGLGKTIEAGLVMQELVLRQRVDRVLVICPPAVTLQWQDELAQRFGLRFALYDRAFISARRRERGFGVNPWTTHPRFIVSYAMLRGARGRGGAAQHLELLLSALGEKAGRTLLVLDECHQVAPAGGAVYPIDSRTTRAVRQVSERVGHRLFLSATPHNGHSQSFSSLLHLLDPQRFTRGLPIQSADELAPVMVRRLKRDLRATVSGLPERILVDHEVELGAESADMRLGRLLAEYDAIYRACLAGLPERQRLARSLVIVTLHKRLLSSVAAFHQTLQLHARGAEQALRAGAHPLPPRAAGDEDDDERTEDERDADEAMFLAEASFDAGAQARGLRAELLALSGAARATPDARVRALAAWINTHLIRGGRFHDRRLVIFTEYEDTLAYLLRALPPLLHDPRPEAIARYTGRLSEEARERLKATFNQPPDRSPLRVLICTDAAREGINLQAHCADLWHFDLPWNPSRIEQRNGRIDRVLQPSPQVRCHYFDCVDRPEDRVLTYLVRKMHIIRDELGSLSEVVSAQVAARLDAGLRGDDGALIPEAELGALTEPGAEARAAQRELEGRGAALLRGDLEQLQAQLLASERRLGYRPEHLAALVHEGLIAVCGAGLSGPLPTPAGQAQAPEAFALPTLDPSWGPVLELLREPEGEVEGDPRRRPLPPVRPVTFRADHRLDAPAVQLHLGHPFVQRLVARFRAQGAARHDLSRLTLIENTHDSSRRLLVFGRVALFGAGATRLHEDLVVLAAALTADEALPLPADSAEAVLAAERLSEALAHSPRPHPNAQVATAVRQRALRDFGALWPTLAARGAMAAQEAQRLLEARGQREAADLRALLLRQRAAIEAQLRVGGPEEGALLPTIEAEREQLERDRRFLLRRLDDLEAELNTEPAAIEASYAVALQRFEPVGLAYLWPAS